MGEIRPLEESHIPEVAALQLKIIRRQPRPPGRDLQKYFGDIFLRNPWRADDIPSLVYLDGGRIVGFLGVIARPMMWGKRPVRIAVASQFMVDREQYRGFAGLELLKRFFQGPQDISYTDGATEAAHVTWTAAGACAASLYSLEWTRSLRPARYARGMLEQRKGAWRWLGKTMAPAGWLTDIVLSKIPLRVFSPPTTGYRSQDASADELFQAIQEIGWREKLKPAYEPVSFRWLMAQTAEARFHGTLRMAVVRDPTGALAGWYAYFSKPGCVSVVMQIGAHARHIDNVFLALLRDAWERGAAAVRGRAIPRYLTNFNDQHCSFRHIGSGVLVQARDPELLTCILRGDAAFSLLDGEWWLRFAVGDWD
jgi:hypothetical protein